MDVPGFYFCICPDAVLAREHLAGFLAGLDGADGSVSREFRIWWADDGLDGRYWEALTLQGLADRPRVLLVRNAQTLPADVWKKLSSLLASPRSGILPVFFLEGVWEKKQPKLPAHISKLRCLAFADQKGWVWRAPGLDARSLRSHVQNRAAGLGLRFEPTALAALCDILAPDAASVQGALEQLLLAVEPGDDGLVKEDMIRQMAVHSPELMLFDLIRCLQEGHMEEVWKILLGEGDGGESVLFPLLGLLAREARLLWQLQVGESVFIPPHLAGAKRALASRLGRTGLTRIFVAVMEAEWAVKSGQNQPRQALENLVAGLGLLFSVTRTR